MLTAYYLVDLSVENADEKMEQLIKDKGSNCLGKEIRDFSENSSLFSGYLQYANPIHYWYVKNIQEEFDDGCLYYLSYRNITKLINDCESILAIAEFEENDIKDENTFNLREIEISLGEVAIRKSDNKMMTKETQAIAEKVLPVKLSSPLANLGGNFYDEEYIKTIKKVQSALKRLLKQAKKEGRLIAYFTKRYACL